MDGVDAERVGARIVYLIVHLLDEREDVAVGVLEDVGGAVSLKPHA